MPSSCSAPRCTNSNREGYCCVKFAQDPELRQKWIDAVGNANWNPPKSAVLCEVHFHPSALYRVGNKKFLKKNIIPSLFCCCNEPVKRQPLADIRKKRRTEKYVHTLDCIVKKKPIPIDTLKKALPENKNYKIISTNKAVPAKDENSLEVNVLQIYEAMQVKLKNIMQENEALRERVYCLQDDLMHIKSFRFPTIH